MTRIIDVEARAMERDTYRPLFRVTDVDRRQERKVFRRENDGPMGTWEERLALSDRRREKLVKPRYGEDTADSEALVLVPILQSIIADINSQIAMHEHLGLAISTIASRCSQAARRGLIEARRVRMGAGGKDGIRIFYAATRDGVHFVEANKAEYAKRMAFYERKAVEAPNKRFVPPSPLRTAILMALADGEWKSVSQIVKIIDRDSSTTSSCAARCVGNGFLERQGGGGYGSAALYRITDDGKLYLMGRAA